MLKTEQVNWPKNIIDDGLTLAREFDAQEITNSIYSLINKTTDSVDLEVKAVAVTGLRQAISIHDQNNIEIFIFNNIYILAIFE